MRHTASTVSTVSSDETDEAIVMQDSDTLGWYHIQYPDYSAMQDSDSEGPDGLIEQEAQEQVFITEPSSPPLHPLPPTIPPVSLIPTAMQAFPASLIQKISLSYPLTFDPEAVWHAWALSPGKTAILGLHLQKADGFVLGVSIAAV